MSYGYDIGYYEKMLSTMIIKRSTASSSNKKVIDRPKADVGQ